MTFPSVFPSFRLLASLSGGFFFCAFLSTHFQKRFLSPRALQEVVVFVPLSPSRLFFFLLEERRSPRAASLFSFSGPLAKLRTSVPSIRVDGTTFFWLPDAAPLSYIPSWLLKVLRARFLHGLCPYKGVLTCVHPR